jgi:hypothetical protein
MDVGDDFSNVYYQYHLYQERDNENITQIDSHNYAGGGAFYYLKEGSPFYIFEKSKDGLIQVLKYEVVRYEVWESDRPNDPYPSNWTQLNENYRPIENRTFSHDIFTKRYLYGNFSSDFAGQDFAILQTCCRGMDKDPDSARLFVFAKAKPPIILHS